MAGLHTSKATFSVMTLMSGHPASCGNMGVVSFGQPVYCLEIPAAGCTQSLWWRLPMRWTAFSAMHLKLCSRVVCDARCCAAPVCVPHMADEFA